MQVCVLTAVLGFSGSCPVSGGTFSSTAIEIIKWVKKIAVEKAKVSHILRPGNTAFKEQLMVLKDSIKGYMRKRKKEKKASRCGSMLAFACVIF
jgi:hypothetical protein